jgi:moderate conductance mechanosensitive channel
MFTRCATLLNRPHPNPSPKAGEGLRSGSIPLLPRWEKGLGDEGQFEVAHRVMLIFHQQRQRTRTGLRQFATLTGLIAAIIVLAAAMPTWGQIPTPSPQIAPGLQLNLPMLNSLFAGKTATIDQGSVRLDGYTLFVIAAPSTSTAATTDPTSLHVRPQPPDRQTPIDLRVGIIENRLQRIATSSFDPQTLKVINEIDGTSRLPVINVSYMIDNATRTDDLLTVTTLDTELHATDADSLAKEWTQVIKTALLKAEQERSPVSIRQQTRFAAGIFVGMVLVSLGLSRWQRRLAAKRHQLSTRLRDETEEIAATTEKTGAADVSTTLLQQQMDHRQQRGMNEIQRRLFQFSQVGIWGSGVFAILGLFPYTRPLQPIVLDWVQIPLKTLAIAFVTYLSIRLGGVFLDRLFLVLQDSASLAPEASQRSALRFSTFSRVSKSILAGLLVAVGMATALAVINIQVGPLLAGAGIIGLAVSFASQSLIKDMINGFLILLEDQYGVGDVIIVGDVSGLVENMNLRITQLRNDEGRLITIPNSAITIVQNLSKEWSRVDLRIDVAYSADINHALKIIDQVAEQMSSDRYWRDLILEPPEMLGVDNLDYAGATVRLWIKTQPLKQWEVAREYRRRLKGAFDEAGIHFGVPQQSLVVRNEEEEDAFREDLHKDSRPNVNQR